MSDQKNTILAIVLSAIVLIAWEYFYVLPQKQQQEALQRLNNQFRQSQTTTPPVVNAPGDAGAPGATPSLGPGAPAVAVAKTREEAIASAPRVRIETPRIKGSISLKGGLVDDISLTQYHETVDPKSAAIELLSPNGSPHPFYAEFGWVAAAGTAVNAPGPDTVWQQQGSGALTPGSPVTLSYDNGAGLTFRRTIAVDDKYLFTLKDEVTNNGTSSVALFPYGRVYRYGTPQTMGYAVLHEGLIGVLGDQGLQEIKYSTIDDKKTMSFKASKAWLGITDKYWAAALIPDPDAQVTAEFSAVPSGATKVYRADYLLEQRTAAPGSTITADARLFAGAKEVQLVDEYEKTLNLDRFDRLIDWGYLYFITKPMFRALDFFFYWTGNFGVAILIVTILLKTLFFPLANKSYASMAKMKAVQPQMQALRERFPDDKVKQQQELMELYKREKINPVAGCLPVLIQVPVFFALYKVLIVTIEMRHAPFFGWIQDLSAPDPTNLFTLFGLLPVDPTHVPIIGSYLVMGIWPLIMGITMWCQMKLNPAPPDPAQKMMFDWMPIIFTFMLASFASGLVIYWAWNNTLSVLQQSVIMRRHGAKIELFDNLRGLFARKKVQS